MPRLPVSPEPAFTPGRPALLRTSPTARWAPVVHTVVARSAPRPDAAPVGGLTALTPEGTTNLALVLGSAVSQGTVWAKVPLPVLPNGTVGWVPRSALGGYVFVHTRLVIDRHRLTATLVRDGRVVFRAPIGVGEPRWPTPGGSFYIRVRLTSFRSPMYGPVAFGTNARSPVLTDWPGGGFVGIHGTDTPQILPGRVSHGCIRLRNTDILRLDHLMPVGTPVRIV
jgi:lipoprotein-anchoring transpeptidase ErfK/SrfK